MEKFLKEKNNNNGGVQKIYFFDNGYGASVVRHSFSYGNELGLWELAVIHGDISNWDLTFGTTITNDVLGYLTLDDVDKILNKIKNLN